MHYLCWLVGWLEISYSLFMRPNSGENTQMFKNLYRILNFLLIRIKYKGMIG